MKTNLKVVRKYAKSFFEVVDPSQLEATSAALHLAGDVWAGSAEARAYILNPSESLEKRLALVREVAAAAKPGDEAFSRFLQLLAANRRISALPDIAKAFAVIYDEYRKLFALDVTSANQISNEEREAMLVKVRADFGGLASIDWHTDASLIGGMVVKAGDKVLDASVRGSLAQLKAALIA